MNIPPVMAQGPVVMQQVMPQQPVVNPVMVSQQGGQQGLPGPPGPAQEKLDNISKVKSLIGPLRESLAATLKTAAHTLHQNSLVDIGSLKNVPPVDVTTHRFDKSMEEFYSICDQIELHLKTSIECMNQSSSSQRYLSLNVQANRTEPGPNQDLLTLTYPQYLNTVRTQVTFAKEVHGMLLAAAQNITTTE